MSKVLISGKEKQNSPSHSKSTKYQLILNRDMTISIRLEP